MGQNLLSWLQRGILIGLGVALLGLSHPPAWSAPLLPEDAAASAQRPAQLFEVHCVGCHPNGGNIIRRGKNLKAKALKRYGYGDGASITDIIAHGKGVMSAYDDRLSPEEIQALATYVLERAEAGW